MPRSMKPYTSPTLLLLRRYCIVLLFFLSSLSYSKKRIGENEVISGLAFAQARPGEPSSSSPRQNVIDPGLGAYATDSSQQHDKRHLGVGEPNPRGAALASPRTYANRFIERPQRNLLDSIKDFRFNAPPPLYKPLPIEGAGHDSSSASSSEKGNGEQKNSQRRRNGDEAVLLDELELSPLVLAVTVDGHVHALKRETGQWVWTLHDDGGVELGGTGDSSKRQGRAGSGEAIGGPLVKGKGKKKLRANGGQSGLGGDRPFGNETGVLLVDEESETYIIEPCGQGDVYLYSKVDESLEKLPLSMQELVGLSPFTFPSDTSRMFAARKESKLIGVDLKTGRLVGVFGSDAGWCEWDEQREGRVRADIDSEEDISRRPQDLLYLARTEYHLSIYSKSPYSLLQTLTYTTYSSSSIGSTLQQQWTQTPDDRYLQSMHDGQLVCFLAGVPELQWAILFDSPVASVFDIAVPDQAGGRHGESAQPMIFEQPHPLPVKGLPVAFDKLHVLPETTFIGQIGDDLFAMSREHYPLVAVAPPSWASERALSNGQAAGSETVGGGAGVGDTDAKEVKCEGIDCIIGRHLLRHSLTTHPDSGIDPPSERLGIEAPPDYSSDRATVTATSTPKRIGGIGIQYGTDSSLQAFVNNASTLIVLFLSICVFFYLKKVSKVKSQPTKQEVVQISPIEKQQKPREGLASSIGPIDSQRIQPSSLKRQPDGSQFIGDKETANPTMSQLEQSPFTPVESLQEKQGILSMSRSRSSSSGSVRDPLLKKKELSNDLPPEGTAESSVPGHSPNASGGDLTNVDDADGDSDVDVGKDGVGGDDAPRRRGRRRRGKKTKKNGKQFSNEDPLGGLLQGAGRNVEVGLDGELKAIVLSEIETSEVLSGKDLTSNLDADSNQIGGLIVSDTILGYGSHGTVVLKGQFQGRAVAVKRLLKDFVTIATHEVALLQESDDHPHVIRYFCKEQRDTFLYIALELCPASLHDLIDQPNLHPDLSALLDPKKALRQVTSGVRHLHKLKIVHRDIKPQNILVSNTKHGGVRMLISDFGLCKKLDMDESSFQQTANHAAGSFGYRAPEILRGQVDPDESARAGTASSGTTDSNNTKIMLGGGTPADPSMRLTRSIDIFSLGCIFYYVLTGGEHPFGGRYEREMNILQGKITLESLDGLGEEAVEVQDLITRMAASDPRERPTADAVLLHPFFWNAQKRLLFLCDSSDRFEIMERDPPTPTLLALEEDSREVVGDDWQKAIDRSLLDNLGKYRKYDGRSVRDLLRVFRNKKHHYQDLPDNVRKNLGNLPAGFLSYFTTRFPRLLLHVYYVVEAHLMTETMFASIFKLPEEEV